jgi:hypothetical protein
MVWRLVGHSSGREPARLIMAKKLSWGKKVFIKTKKDARDVVRQSVK